MILEGRAKMFPQYSPKYFRSKRYRTLHNLCTTNEGYGNFLLVASLIFISEVETIILLQSKQLLEAFGRTDVGDEEVVGS